MHVMKNLGMPTFLSIGPRINIRWYYFLCDLRNLKKDVGLYARQYVYNN